MPGYLSGAEALADARLRLAELAPDQAILMLEGRDDVRLFGPHAVALEALIPCGNKCKLLDAYGRLRTGEERQLLFVADCDYDVPSGRLSPAPNLLLTEHADLESDLFGAGIVDRIVFELVPAASESSQDLSTVAGHVSERASALAEAVGQLRHVSAVEGLGLRFEDLRYRKFRIPGTTQVDRAKLTRALHQRTEACSCGPDELEARAAEAPVGLVVCQGKDLMGSLATVLHEDFGVPVAEVRALPRLLRASMDAGLLERLRLIQRIRRWERGTGRRVLR